MSYEQFFHIRVLVWEENDGATFANRGPETMQKIVTVEEALAGYGGKDLHNSLLTELNAAIAAVVTHKEKGDREYAAFCKEKGIVLP